MLIPPEQAREASNLICDNQSQQQEKNSHEEMFPAKSTSLDNSNIIETDGKLAAEQLTDEFDTDCATTDLTNPLDIKNCNIPKSYSPLQRMRSKLVPHINLSNSKKLSPLTIRRTLYTNDDVNSDLSQPLSPMSASPSRSPPVLIPGPDNDKQEVISGRLYLIRHTGNVSPSQTPSSPSRGQMKCFPFQMNPGIFYSPSSSPPSPSSPTLGTKRKTPVYMRVYKCNMDHFALVSRDSSYSSRHVYLNMRHCRVLPGDCIGRFVIAGHCDSGSLMEFETSDLSSLEKWLDALQNGTPPGSPIRHANAGGNTNNSSNSTCSPSIPKSPALPTLTETEDEN